MLRPKPPRPNRSYSLPRLAAAAGLYAAAEIAAGILIGGFFPWGRAEALLFLAFRPWLLLAAALLIAGRPWRVRLLLYVLALTAAGFSESLLLIGLGSPNPWPEMLRGWGAGALFLAVADPVLQVGRRWRGRIGQSIGTALIVLLLVVPGGMRPYERIALGPTGPHPDREKPALLLMTALPLIWGETGAFDPESRPAAAYLALRREFSIRPVDYLDEETLSGNRLMLLAQPRALAPEELVALDAWVRQGGYVLILADPSLTWPTRLPPGDIRRPPPVSLLAPLFRHWGVALETEAEPRMAIRFVEQDGALRRLRLAAPGRLLIEGGGCRLAGAAWLAACRIGEGRALIAADADLLHDAMWTGPVADGGGRHARTADNPSIVAAWLDRLAGIDRKRAEREVRWQEPGADRIRAALFALAPILALMGAAVLPGRFRRA